MEILQGKRKKQDSLNFHASRMRFGQGHDLKLEYKDLYFKSGFIIEIGFEKMKQKGGRL